MDNVQHPRMGVTLTFGECAENHVGMQKLGEKGEHGFTLQELSAAKEKFEANGCVCELIDLSTLVGADGSFLYEGARIRVPPAAVLLVRGGAQKIMEKLGASAEDLLDEQMGLDPDQKALMKGRVVNKHARWNLCFTEDAQEPDYAAGKGRVVAFADVPQLDALQSSLRFYFGDKALGLKAEANYYFDVEKCGIGYHGDGERKIVVAVRLGAAFPLCYQWYYKGGRVGARMVLLPASGDLYAMSDKAVGWDWKRTTVPTLRHAAGCEKYTG